MAKERQLCRCDAVIVIGNQAHHVGSGACLQRANRKRQRRERHNAHVSMMRDRKDEERRQRAAA